MCMYIYILKSCWVGRIDKNYLKQQKHVQEEFDVVKDIGEINEGLKGLLRTIEIPLFSFGLSLESLANPSD